MAVRFFHECMPLPESVPSAAAAVRFPADSDWFSGHFPGNPIVPGIALIALAEEAVVQQERCDGRSVAIVGVRRVRFRLPVQPEDAVTVEVTRVPDRQGPAYSFAICLAGEAVCTGILTAAVVSP
ncbi:MAG: hypothetical protein LLG97_18270 [Deltaproteobacteria bacterium]|nr:hypothetical protein [Deltaproteobacteria bacterium]